METVVSGIRPTGKLTFGQLFWRSKELFKNATRV